MYFTPIRSFKRNEIILTTPRSRWFAIRGYTLTGYASGCLRSLRLFPCSAVVLLGLTLAGPQIRSGVRPWPWAFKDSNANVYGTAFSVSLGTSVIIVCLLLLPVVILDAFGPSLRQPASQGPATENAPIRPRTSIA